MDLQDLQASPYIRASHMNLPVKASRPEDRRIQDIDTVGGSHHDDALIL